MAKTSAPHRIGTEIIPASVVGHEHDYVWLFVLRPCGLRNETPMIAAIKSATTKYLFFHLRIRCSSTSMAFRLVLQLAAAVEARRLNTQVTRR